MAVFEAPNFTSIRHDRHYQSVKEIKLNVNWKRQPSSFSNQGKHGFIGLVIQSLLGFFKVTIIVKNNTKIVLMINNFNIHITKVKNGNSSNLTPWEYYNFRFRSHLRSHSWQELERELREFWRSFWVSPKMIVISIKQSNLIYHK